MRYTITRNSSTRSTRFARRGIRLLNQMLTGINLGGTGAQIVNGTTWTGAMAVRTNTTTRDQLANGNVGAFVNTLNTLTTGTGSANKGPSSEERVPGKLHRRQPAVFGRLDVEQPGQLHVSRDAVAVHRVSAGFTNTTTWTWSKALGDSDTDTGTTYRDPTNRSIEKTNLGFDHAHQITSNGIYELPFGTGVCFLATLRAGFSRSFGVAIGRHHELQLGSALEHHFWRLHHQHRRRPTEHRRTCRKIWER